VRRRRLRFQNGMLLTALAGAAPAWIAASLLLIAWPASANLRWSIFGLLTLVVLAGAVAVQRRAVRPLQSLANLLEALREGDYSLRGRPADSADAVGEVMHELNLLSQMLYERRLQDIEAGVLLGKVISEIDIAVFAFDHERRLRVVNPAGEALLGAGSATLAGATAEALGLDTMLNAPTGTILAHRFAGASGRWEIRRRAFREGGWPHELLVISDLSRALRDEERQAWRRLVRVIGHELNSSLTPIKSMAATLRQLVDRDPLPQDFRTDSAAGLEIIHDRAEALARFMGAYARLARLPRPVPKPIEYAPLVTRIASLHDGRVAVAGGPAVQVNADADQIEQVLINLIRNAVEAAGESGHVRVGWHTADRELVTEIEDDGPGLARTDNLWVPFFTTKPGGTGIGLALSREIIENHGGRIALENRADARGCVARFSLPLGDRDVLTRS
jgi:two-component system, NtrC family, nitrogen regulation sensor histidine kinase NtrY